MLTYLPTGPLARAAYLRALTRATYAPTAARYVRATGALAARAARYANALAAAYRAAPTAALANARATASRTAARYATLARRAGAPTYA